MRSYADDRLLTLDEVAELLRADESTVRRMIQRGELRALQLGGLRGRPLRFRESDIQEALAGWRNR